MFWLPLLSVALAGVLTAGTLYLSGRRDFGVGTILQCAGRSSAARWVHGPFALALRLERDLMLGWVFELAVLGLLIGAAPPGLDSQLAGTAFAEVAARPVRHCGGSVRFQT